MRKYNIQNIIKLFLFLSFFQTFLYPQWTELNSSSREVLNSTAIIDENKMCAVGSGGVILASSNGGDNWLTKSGGVVNDLFFITSYGNTYWAVGSGGVITKSTDAGISWSPMQSGTIADLICVKFFNESLGIIVGRNGTVLKTTDGGATWVTKNSSTTQVLRGVDFTDASNWFAVGGELASYNSIILRSTNGGENWSLVYSSYLKPLTAIDFLNASTGFAVGINGFVLKTTNGGAYWFELATPTFHWIYSVKVVNDYEIIAVGGNVNEAVILGSGDGGDSWFVYADLPAQWLFGIDFYGNDLALVVGDYGKIFKNTNGGFNWRISPLGTSVQLNSVSMNYDSRGLVCGSGGAVFYTSDFGHSWNPRQSNTTNQLNALQTLGNDAWIAGASGTILKSTDNSETWQSVPSGILDELLDIEFLNSEFGLAIGRNGRILKSVNGGNSWVIKNGFLNGSLRKVEIVSPTTAFIIGGDFSKSSSFILKSTDSGESWVSLPLPSVFYQVVITSIDFITESLGYVVSTGGMIFKTSNGGISWTSQSSQTSHWLYDVKFLDDNIGYAVGGNIDEGIVLSTKDGGITWHKEIIPYIQWLYSISFAYNNIGLICGHNGRILRNLAISSVIPVELLTFFAEQSFETVELKWQTATETNNMGFYIDKMVDNEWENISFILGQGTTTSGQSYSYRDNLKNYKSTAIIKYRLRQVDYNGTIAILKEIELLPTVSDFGINQNYPNPFNPETIISFRLPKDNLVKVSVFNSLGEEVRVLINTLYAAGSYEYLFNASDLPSGIYFYSISAGEFNSVKKMILLK